VWSVSRVQAIINQRNTPCTIDGGNMKKQSELSFALASTGKNSFQSKESCDDNRTMAAFKLVARRYLCLSEQQDKK
jgi:hypothetical protein